MSEIVQDRTTDLPIDGMEPDFVSREGDYDFPLYLSTKEEWVNNDEKKTNEGGEEGTNEKIGVEPFLIMELNRFVPYSDGGSLVNKFHPLNMPRIEIGVVEIAGLVLDVYETDKFDQYTVDDGTGTIVIYYGKSIKFKVEEERREIDDKYIKHLSSGKIDVDLLKTDMCPDKFSEPRPGFKYPKGTRIEDVLIFEHNWSLETEYGTRGKPIKLCEHVYAKGRCLLNFLYHEEETKEITADDLSDSCLILMADEVRGLTERQYNDKVLCWLETDVQKRYNEGPLETFADARVPVFDMRI